VRPRRVETRPTYIWARCLLLRIAPENRTIAFLNNKELWAVEAEVCGAGFNGFNPP